ncbi:MAG: TolC family protein [Candidatus Omnitrophica bacterium]|nr:TolC family protein [Candidatus Omnitrophota bacterium]
MRHKIIAVFFCIAATIAGSLPALGDGAPAAEQPLALEEFIRQVCRADTKFEEILMEKFRLQYLRSARLPAGDLTLAVKAQYDFFLSEERSDPETKLSLEKLFPFSGTAIALSYANTPASSTGSRSEFEALISQPIAENAFGKNTRILDKLVGTEIDVARFQIIEAYEDYLAALVSVYLSWSAAHETLHIAQTSYAQNRKLQDNIDARRRRNIALPIDVHKVRLTVIAKQEALLVARQEFERLSVLVNTALRAGSAAPRIPVRPAAYQEADIVFAEQCRRFREQSRTVAVLRLLEKQRALELEKAADELLPSINFLFGYREEGDERRFANRETRLFAGISLQWPFPGQQERAAHEIAGVSRRKITLSNQNTLLSLETNLKNLYAEILRERELLTIAEEKIELAQAVLAHEAENYSFGKVTLNDYIQAANVLDENRLSKVSRVLKSNTLVLEWLRLTDQLVSERVIE